MDKLRIRFDFLQIDFDRAVTWFFCLYFSSGLVRLVARRGLAVVRLQSLYVVFTNLVIYLPLLLVLILMISKHRLDKSLWRFFLVLGAVVFAFALSLLMHPEYGRFFSRDTYGIWDDVFRPDSGAVFGCLAALACRNSRRLLENLKYASLLLFLYSAYQFLSAIGDGYWTVLDAAGNTVEQNYNLGFGYTVIFCATVFFGFFIRERRKIYLVLGGLSTAFALLGGSRGCMLCLLVFGILFLFKEFSAVPLHKKLLIAAAAMLAGVLFNLFYYSILSSLSGIDARTIQMFLSGDISSDNGRDAIYAIASEALKSLPFLGYGAFGDRPFITPYYYWGYCHNICLELILDFGWLLGLFAFVFLSFKCVKVLVSARDEQAFIICVLLSANAKLFLSDSFWGYPQFWMLIGYLFFVFQDERRGKPGGRIRLKKTGEPFYLSKRTEDKNG